MVTAAALLNPSMLDALSKIGGVGALLLTFGLFVWAFLKAGSLVKDEMRAQEAARSADHKEGATILRQLGADLGRVNESITRLTGQVEELRRSS